MNKTIEAYSLPEFIRLVQTSVQDGWEIDFDDGDAAPVSWASYYRCEMHKGKKIAALFLPPAPPAPNVLAVSPTPLPEPEVYAHLAEPFVPSVVFEMSQPQLTAPKKVGRPKASMI